MKPQSRNLETREQELRDLPFEFEPDAALSLPPGVRRDDYAYKYISVNMIERSLRMGYTLVELSRITGPVFIDPTKKNALADTYVTLGDTVLGEISITALKKIHDYYNRKAHDKNKIQGVTDTNPNPNRFG